MNRSSDHLPFLDGIRGIAILVVFLYHSLSPSFGLDRLPWDGMFRAFDTSVSFLLVYPLTYGWVGVPAFFVVSGFCIHLSHQRSRDKGWLHFIVRRFFRIYPPYLLAICTFFFLWPWGSVHDFSPTRLIQFATHALSIHNLDRRTIYGINPSFWSIAVEIQLYALYPLLLYLSSRFSWRKAMIVAGIAEISIGLASSMHSILSDGSLPRYLTASPFACWLSWSFGAYLCECILQGRQSRLFSPNIGVIAVISALLPLFKPTEPFAFLSFSWLTAIAVDRLANGRWTAPAKGGISGACWSHLSFLGTVSYSFYLFHQPMFQIVRRLYRQVFPAHFDQPLLVFAACVASYPFVLCFSILIYRWVEKPSISLGKIVWERLGATRSAVPLTRGRCPTRS